MVYAECTVWVLISKGAAEQLRGYYGMALVKDVGFDMRVSRLEIRRGTMPSSFSILTKIAEANIDWYIV